MVSRSVDLSMCCPQLKILFLGCANTVSSPKWFINCQGALRGTSLSSRYRANLTSRLGRAVGFDITGSWTLESLSTTFWYPKQVLQEGYVSQKESNSQWTLLCVRCIVSDKHMNEQHKHSHVVYPTCRRKTCCYVRVIHINTQRLSINHLNMTLRYVGVIWLLFLNWTPILDWYEVKWGSKNTI